jgi:plasmid replication initiation protein
MGYNHTNYNDIKNALKKIQQTQIRIKEDMKIWTIYTSWFSTVALDESPGDVRISINPDIKNHLVGLRGKFVKYNSENLFRLNGSYTKQFYVYLKSLSFKDENDFLISVDDLRDLFCIEDKYPRYANFKNRILTYIIDEITNKTDLFVNFVEIKTGNKVKSLVFYTRKQDFDENNLINPTIEFLQKKYGFNKTMSEKLLKAGGTTTKKSIEEAEKYINNKKKNKEDVNPKKVVVSAIQNKWGSKKEIKQQRELEKQQTVKPIENRQVSPEITPPDEFEFIDKIYSDKELKEAFEYFLLKERPSTFETVKEFGIEQYKQMQPMLIIQLGSAFKRSEYYRIKPLFD